MIVINKRVTNIPHQIIILEEINVIKLYKKFILNPMFVIIFYSCWRQPVLVLQQNGLQTLKITRGIIAERTPFAKYPAT